MRPSHETSEYPAAACAACSRRNATRPAGIFPSTCTRLASTSPAVAPTRAANAAPAEPRNTPLPSTDRPAPADRPAACRSSAVPIPRRRDDGSTVRYM